MSATQNGCGLAEAVVALAIAAVAFAGVVAAARTATLALHRAAASQAATAAATERLEVLRAAPAGGGSDVLPGTTPVMRTWRRIDGRGRPDHLAAAAECDATRVALDSAVWP